MANWKMWQIGRCHVIPAIIGFYLFAKIYISKIYLFIYLQHYFSKNILVKYIFTKIYLFFDWYS